MSRNFVLALVVLMFLSACAPAAAPAKPEDSTLRIGTLPNLDLLPLFVAEKQGYFKAQGITVTFVPAQSAAERDQLMQAGQIDGFINDMVSVVLYNKDTVKIKVVRTAIAATPTWSQFSIFAAKDSKIQSAADLKGVEIGVSQATVIEYVTARLLADAGLAPSDIKTTNVIKIADGCSCWRRGSSKPPRCPSRSPRWPSNKARGASSRTPKTQILEQRHQLERAGDQDKPNTVSPVPGRLRKGRGRRQRRSAKWQPLLVENQIIPPALTSYKLPVFPRRPRRPRNNLRTCKSG